MLEEERVDKGKMVEEESVEKKKCWRKTECAGEVME
jgi:hypothetical protein